MKKQFVENVKKHIKTVAIELSSWYRIFALATNIFYQFLKTKFCLSNQLPVKSCEPDDKMLPSPMLPVPKTSEPSTHLQALAIKTTFPFLSNIFLLLIFLYLYYNLESK